MRYIARIPGTTEAVLLCDIPGTIASSRKDSIQADLAGLVGDRHYGHTFLSNARFPYPRGTEIKNSRHISIISVEEMAEVAQSIGVPRLLPEWLGANLYFSGVPALTHLPPASRVHFASGTVIVIQGENDPCSNPGNLIQQNYPDIHGLSPAFVKNAIHKRGLVAWVEKPGRISSGETFEIEVPEQFDYTRYIQRT